MSIQEIPDFVISELSLARFVDERSPRYCLQPDSSEFPLEAEEGNARNLLGSAKSVEVNPQ